MNTSPPSKRTKLDPSPSLKNDQHPDDIELNDGHDDLEQEHCTICLQPFLDRTIIPVCAHEFCFECILLWSEQSRKCPLCSRSFVDSYLIHHIRSQYDYQKHHLTPLRSSPPPLLTRESRENALRSTRRERQWGRRQRREREEADQLERAIARRRWIYQHHLYAKHVASNPYTRHRPFPTPTQFAASPDLISRMTIFLRRELRVWPDLDVEFLTTYTVSLMKSIDIRSESAVKLLSEFLDLDTPYAPGKRYANAEHFAHEIYSYLRSPYRDLNTYDQTAQYDTPPDISPPRELERGSRWSPEAIPCPPRSRSHRLSTPHREDSPAPAKQGRGNSAGPRRDAGPRQSRDCSPRRVPPGREIIGSRNYPDGIDPNFRDGHTQNGEVSYPEASRSATRVDSPTNNFPVLPHIQSDEKGKGRVADNVGELVPTTNAPKTSVPADDDSATALTVDEGGAAHVIVQGGGDEVADYVDKVRGGSSANAHLSRKRPASDHVYPRNRTLSASVQAYLYQSVAPRRPSRQTGQRPTRGPEADVRPSLLLRLADGPSGPEAGNLPSSRKTTANGDPEDNEDDEASEQQHHGYRPQSRRSTAVRRAHMPLQRGNEAADACATRPHPVGVPSGTDDGGLGTLSADDCRPGYLGFPPDGGAPPGGHVGVVSSRADASASGALRGRRRGSGHGVPVVVGAVGAVGDSPRRGDGPAETPRSPSPPSAHGWAAPPDARGGDDPSVADRDRCVADAGGPPASPTTADVRVLDTRLRLHVRLAAMHSAGPDHDAGDAATGAVPAPHRGSRDAPSDGVTGDRGGRGVPRGGDGGDGIREQAVARRERAGETGDVADGDREREVALRDVLRDRVARRG